MLKEISVLFKINKTIKSNNRFLKNRLKNTI